MFYTSPSRPHAYTLASPLGVLCLSRGVSGLLAVLVMGLVVVGLMSAALTVYYRVNEASNYAVERASRVLSEASQPPVMSLSVSSGALYSEVYSSKPVEVSFFIVDYANGTLKFAPGGLAGSNMSVFKLVDIYSCEPVRVYMVLSSGVVVAYDPRVDPKIGYTPKGWRGYYTCNLELDPVNNSLIDPSLGLPVAVVAGGSNETVIYTVGSTTIISATVILDGEGRCNVNYRGFEVTARTISTPAGPLDIVVGCLSTPGWNELAILDPQSDTITVYRVLNLPLTVYLMLKGPPNVAYSGSLRVSVSSVYRTSDTISPSVSGVMQYMGLIPVTYTPAGSFRYRVERYIEMIETPVTYRLRWDGWGEANFTSSRLLVPLVWTYFRPLDGARIDMTFTLRVDYAIEYAGKPARLDLGAVGYLEAKLLKGNITGIDSFSESIIKAYRQKLPQTPRVHAKISVDSNTYTRILTSEDWTRIAYQNAQIALEAEPPIDPPLLNGIQASYTEDPSNWRRTVYSGSSFTSPNYSPWRPPALVEARLGDSKMLIILAWPGKLKLIQAGRTYRGYAQLVPEAPLEVKPPTTLAITPLTIDGGTIKASITLTRTQNPTLTSLRQKYIAITAPLGNPSSSETIITWVN